MWMCKYDASVVVENDEPQIMDGGDAICVSLAFAGKSTV